MKYIIKCSRILDKKIWYYESHCKYDKDISSWTGCISDARKFSLGYARVILHSIVINDYWINRTTDRLKLKIINIE